MDHKVPTIKEIAKKLNVSVSTVSRAMSNNKRIGEGTRLRIQEYAKQLNYEPNAQAISFSKKENIYHRRSASIYQRRFFFGGYQRYRNCRY